MKKPLFMVVIPIIFILGCVEATTSLFPYQPPTGIVAPEVSVLFRNSKAAVFKAAQQVIVSEGYQITNVNEAAGTISTALRNLRLTTEQANCGTRFRLTYIEDPRAVTRVGFGVLVEESKLTVRANIEGEFKPGGRNTMNNFTFTCVSTGTLEKSLLDKIMAAAGSR